MKALEVRQLTKTYKNGLQALKGISLSVEQGDFFALLGPNGAGKTTLIGIISSLVNKTGGQVFIFDNSIDVDFETAKTFIGVVPQEFNFGIFERVDRILIAQAGYYGIARTAAKKRAEELLKQLDLWDKRHDIARSLSGGMKRRLLIARALMHIPKLLILDEPTAGVDVEARRLMWDFLREINKETTIILTTHYLEEAETLCKNIAIIDHGNIVENTSMSALLYKLNLETFVLYLKQPMLQIPALSGFTYRRVDDHTLEVDVRSSQTVNQLFQELSTHGIEIQSMRNKSNRLEELFLSLTADDRHAKN